MNNNQDKIIVIPEGAKFQMGDKICVYSRSAPLGSIQLKMVGTAMSDFKINKCSQKNRSKKPKLSARKKR